MQENLYKHIKQSILNTIKHCVSWMQKKKSYTYIWDFHRYLWFYFIHLKSSLRVIPGERHADPSPLQRWLNWVFGPKRCTMFWNVCKNIFLIFLQLFQGSGLYRQKKISQLQFHSNSDLQKFQRMLRNQKKKLFVKNIFTKKIKRIFFHFLRIFWNEFWSSQSKLFCS